MSGATFLPPRLNSAFSELNLLLLKAITALFKVPEFQKLNVSFAVNCATAGYEISVRLRCGNFSPTYVTTVAYSAGAARSLNSPQHRPILLLHDSLSNLCLILSIKSNPNELKAHCQRCRTLRGTTLPPTLQYVVTELS